MKLILSILSAFIFPLSYWVCITIYPSAAISETDPNFSLEEVEKFTDLRFSVYAILCAICFINAGIEFKNNSEWYKKLTKWFLDVGIGFSISDIIDRFCFDITKFSDSDKVMIGITIISSTYFVYFHEKLSDYLKEKLFKTKKS